MGRGVMDTLSSEKRSMVMSRFRTSDNQSTERALVKAVRLRGISGCRRHTIIRLDPDRPAVRPDFIFRQHRVVVFVDGCFWHSCPKHLRVPVANRSYWKKKLEGNRRRDLLTNRRLRAGGWKVLRIWEHSVSANIEACVRLVEVALATADLSGVHKRAGRRKAFRGRGAAG